MKITSNLVLSIEYDEDDDELKVMGPKEGCLSCHKPHWDYVKTGSGHNSYEIRYFLHGEGLIENQIHLVSIGTSCLMTHAL